MENLTNDTLPVRGFGLPLVRYVFHPPRVSLLCFSLYRNPRLSRPEALWEGVQNFSGGRVLWYVFLPPSRFAPPHITAQVVMPWRTQPGWRVLMDFCSCGIFLWQHKDKTENVCKTPWLGVAKSIQLCPFFPGFATLSPTLWIAFFLSSKFCNWPNATTTLLKM